MDQYSHHQWKHLPRLRLLFLVSCIAIVIYFYWVDLKYLSDNSYKEKNRDQLQETKKTESTSQEKKKIAHVAQAMKQQYQQKTTEQEQYKSARAEQTRTSQKENTNQQITKTNSLIISTKNSTKDLKYILFWTVYDMAPFHYFKEGLHSFFKNNCSWVNCYMTTNRTLLDGDIKKFDGIAFNGRTMSVSDLPIERSPHQKYIYFNMESADNYPVCDEKFDGFFNWTSTYKLDSDIPYPYILTRNKKGDIIGPKTNMKWSQIVSEEDSSLAAILANKTKAAAWFVSNCSRKNGRYQFVENLQKALKRYKLSVDVYGKCGTLECPRNEHEKCMSLLQKDYFFYLSLENSFATDYVTEKLLTALLSNTLPIVFGGVDYSRFLPPGSYINARKYDIDELAAYMDELVKDPHKYSQYFRWKSQYRFSDPTERENVCAVCAAFNENNVTSVYYQFRKWWHPNYEYRC